MGEYFDDQAKLEGLDGNYIDPVSGASVELNADAVIEDIEDNNLRRASRAKERAGITPEMEKEQLTSDINNKFSLDDETIIDINDPEHEDAYWGMIRAIPKIISSGKKILSPVAKNATKANKNSPKIDGKVKDLVSGKAKPANKNMKDVKNGRTGRQSRLKELLNDPKVPTKDRGWIRQEINSIKRGQRKNIRNPKGKELAHERGREAAKGYDYKHSNLQDKDLHKLQHKYDKNGVLNKERPILPKD